MSTELAKTKKRGNNIPTKTLSAKHLKELLGEEQARREVLRDYIRKNFIEGVHYSRTCRRKIDGKWKPIYLKKGEKTIKGDEPGKNELFQPGAQTIIDIMKCEYVDGPDEEMIKILGEDAVGWVILRGKVTSLDGKVAYGRGACSIKEKYGFVNNAIKQSQIRCMKNVVINAWALSDLFLQDVDDVTNQEIVQKLNEQQGEKKNLMVRYIDNVMKESTVTDKERQEIESMFENGIEFYNVMHFVNEITDKETIRLMEVVGKKEGRPYIVSLAKGCSCKQGEFLSLLRSINE